jgi:hypothetical protein
MQMSASALGGIAGSNPETGTWIHILCECCVCCQTEVSATGRSPVQRSPTDCGVLMCVI